MPFEIPKKILFLFTFFNLILDAPRTLCSEPLDIWTGVRHLVFNYGCILGNLYTIIKWSFLFCLYKVYKYWGKGGGGGGRVSQVWVTWVLQRSRYRTENNIQLMCSQKRLRQVSLSNINRIIRICPHFIILVITNCRRFSRDRLVGRAFDWSYTEGVIPVRSLHGRWRRCPFSWVGIFQSEHFEQ